MSNCYNSDLPIGLPGPTGPQGIQGLQGLDGTVWLNGPGLPNPDAGVNNDYYLNTLTGNLYIKDFVGLALEWVLVTNIYGTPGAPGQNGSNGTNGVALAGILYNSSYFKSLGLSNYITLANSGSSFYGNPFVFEGNALCPVDDSIARITIFYEANDDLEAGQRITFANVFYNFVITDYSTSSTQGVVGGALPSAYYNDTYLSGVDTVVAYTKVCYTIRRKTINTAEVFTEWSTSRSNNGNLYSAEGQYHTVEFLTPGKINFGVGQFNEFKFFPSITDAVIASNPKTRAISFYVENLR